MLRDIEIHVGKVARQCGLLCQAPGQELGNRKFSQVLNPKAKLSDSLLTECNLIVIC